MALINLDTQRSPTTAGTIRNTALNPSRFPIYWVFNADPTGLPDQKASLTIAFNSFALGQGNTFTINQFLGSFPFVASANPSAYQLDTAIVASSQADDFVNMLNDHPSFNPFYTAVAAGIFITITAKFVGAQYNLSLSNIVEDTAGTILFVTSTNGSNANAAAALKDFKVVLRVYVNTASFSKVQFTFPVPYNANDWELVGDREAVYDPSNRMAVDLSEALNPYVSSPPPEIGLYVFGVVPRMLVKYYFDIYASYIPAGKTTPTLQFIRSVGKDASDEKLYAISGGFPNYEQPVLIHPRYGWFWHRGQSKGNAINFLTAIPKEKPTHIASHEFLYFVYYKLTQGRNNRLHLKYLLEYEDGTSQTIYASPLGQTITYPGTVYYAQVGWQRIRAHFFQLGQPFEQTSLLRKFTVWVVESEAGAYNDVTYGQTYVMDNGSRCRNFEGAQLIFRNFYGGWDTLYLNAWYEKETTSESKTVERNPAWQTKQSNILNFNNPLLSQLPIDKAMDTTLSWLNDPTRLSPEGITKSANYETKNETRYTLRSGYINREEMEWLNNSLMPSNEAYLVAWTEPDNLGNPNQSIMRRVVFENRQIVISQYDDQFTFEATVKLGIDLNSVNG